MKTKLKSIAQIAGIALTALSIAVVSAGRAVAQVAIVSLDRIDGVRVDDSTKIPAGQPITFYIRAQNLTGHNGMCTVSGFRLYSPDGATWIPHLEIDTNIIPFPTLNTTYDTTHYGSWVDTPELAPAVTWHGNCPKLAIYDEANVFINTFKGTGWGTGADTVGFAGFAQGACASALWDGFSAIAWSMAIDSFPQSSIGKTFCIDSSYYPPAGLWLWANGTALVPEWDGPHCFDIVTCCIGMRGNVNGDPLDDVSIPDLTTYVSWAYKGGPTPPCMDEVDVNGDGSIDTADLGYLVAFMFKGGSLPAQCP